MEREIIETKEFTNQYGVEIKYEVIKEYRVFNGLELDVEYILNYTLPTGTTELARFRRLPAMEKFIKGYFIGGVYNETKRGKRATTKTSK